MRSLDLEAFCHAEYARLVRAMTLYTGDRDLAEDLAQEAMARACLHWRKVRKMDHPGAWLHRVAINIANSHFRRRRLERRRSEEEPRVEIPTPETDIAQSLAVRHSVSLLAPRQKMALLYRYFLDLSVDETASLMECSRQTVKKLTHNAVTNLRAKAPEASWWMEASDGS